MYGQAGNPSFGFNATVQSSPFGQSAFGKTIATTSFGTSTPPVFGSNTSLFSSKPTGSTTGSLFGNTTTPSTFGANSAAQSSFGGFGNTNTNAPLFGSQQNANTNLFGPTNGTPSFGQANKPSTFGFGQTSGTALFGQPQPQTAQQSTPFGQSTTSTNTGLFGTSSGFGSASSSGISGTVVKFSPVTGTDTMVKNGVTQTISTRHHCITCMKEYESKSLEELRLEDYAAGRKGVSQGQPSAIFGTATQGSPFGAAVSNSNNSNSGFGAIPGGFGSTSQSTSAGLFSKPITAFGVPATTSSAFAFNSPTSSNLFNTQSKPFGGTASTPLFAASNASSTPGNTFNNINNQTAGFGAGFNSGQANQSIGLFTQNKTAFNMPSSTSATTFGFGQPSSTNTSSLFGSKPIGTGFGTPFSGGTPSTFQAGTTGFGSVQNPNSTLFNNSFKTAGQSSGFTFGNAPCAVSTGIGCAGSSLFNSSTKPNLFGSSSIPSTFNSPGTFGSMSTFGSTNNTVSNLNSNLFGSGVYINNTNHSNGSVPVHQQILALVSAPFGDSPLLKNLLPASGKSEQFLKPSSSISKGISTPYYKIQTGNSSSKPKPKVVATASLSKKSVFDGLEEEDPLLEAFQPRPNAKRLVLRPKSNSLSELNDRNSTSEQCNSTLTEAISKIKDKENEMQINSKIRIDRRSSTSWLKSSFPIKSKGLDINLPSQPTTFSEISVVPTEEELDNTVKELRSPINSENEKSLLNESSLEIVDLGISKNKKKLDSVVSESKSSSDLDEISISSQKSDDVINIVNIKLQRYGYYTIPPLEMLHKYVADKTCIVPNFTIGRKGYGNVFFADAFDIYGLNFDEIVHFRHKEVIIYPDDTTKPPVGQGLNRKAQVTLDRVWPNDKSSHEPITDPKRLIEMDYEGKLRRVSAKHGTRFLEYRPETGSWVFKVEHFSKYGLSDSDDDDIGCDVKREIKYSKGIDSQTVCSNLNDQNFPKTIQRIESDLSVLDNSNVASCNFELRESHNDYIYNRHNKCAYSPSSIHARLVGTESHTLQLMKASFFEIDNNLIQDQLYGINKEFNQNIGNNYKTGEINSESQENRTGIPHFQSAIWSYDNHPDSEGIMLSKSRPTVEKIHLTNNGIDLKTRIGLTMPNVQPKISVLKFKCGIAPSSYSKIIKNRYKYVADIGIQMGKNFRPSWGPQLSLLTLSTPHQITNASLGSSIDQIGSYTSIYYHDDITSTSIVQRLQILGGCNLEHDGIKTFKISIEGHLNIQLQHSNIYEEQGCPIIKVMTGESSISALHAHQIHSQKIDSQLGNTLTKYSSDVWKLCESLWGKLTDCQIFSENISHETTMLRKDAFSKWLKFVTTEIIEREIASMELNDQIILSLLTGNKLEDACSKALKTGDHCLALLVSQLGGSFSVRELMKQQIGLWQDTDVDINLSIYRLKLLMLIAGVPVIKQNNETVNVCENLDWKRALAVHLWYLSHPMSSITDTLDLYERSFSKLSVNVYSLSPRPEYFKNNVDVEINDEKPLYDLCYHLLKLYCTRNYPLEAILNPQTYSYDPLDYRLSWLLHQTLNALGYTYLSKQSAELTHANFAAQLETHDLWHWAIFVALHFQDSVRRSKVVMDLLLRHVELDKSQDYEERERFLEIKLKIPLKWINEAKAVKAFAVRRYRDAAWYFIHAQNWNKAHEIIIEYLVTEAVINEDHEYLKELLTLLMSNNCYTTIKGWTHQGQLIWDYIVITSEVKLLLNQENCGDIEYKLELLQPQLISLCTKITAFPCPSTRHRLCQAEMAKRTLQLIRGFIMIKSKGENISDFLVQVISELPLPEDYAQQELRPLINSCVNNMYS